MPAAEIERAIKVIACIVGGLCLIIGGIIGAAIAGML